MPKCTSCNKAMATIHVLDVEDGSTIRERSLCEACASSEGVTHNKPQSILTTLLSGMQSEAAAGGDPAAAAGLSCPACHLTAAEFKMRGRLGCPRCYEVFRASLLPLLERVHDAVTHRGRYPGRTAGPTDRASGSTGASNAAELRTQLDRAIAEERYEEAARLRDLLNHDAQREPDDTA